MCSVNTRIALATTKNNHLFVSDYYSKMCQYAHDLATSGTPLHDNERIAYLLTGLDEEYNLVFTLVISRSDPVILSDLYAQLLSFEQHTQLQGQSSHGASSSVMIASWGCGYLGSRGLGSTLWYHCERLPYVVCPRVRICRVGQVYTPTGLVIDSDVHDTLGHE
jgi:hypothetical protein